MGLKSFLFRHSGGARRMEGSLARAKATKRDLQRRIAELKARPERRPLDSVAQHEEALREALLELSQDATWQADLPDLPTLVDRVGLAVSASDIMLVKSTPRQYAEVGLSALRCVRQCLTAAHAQPPRSVLDFGCGFGRVLRFLRAAWPDASVYVTDMDAEGLGFCTHHFNTLGFRTDLENAPLWVAARFDLIWVGSVFTHLDVPNCDRLMRHMADFLAPGGRVIFTTHGDYARSLMRQHSPSYRLQPAVLEQILADCDQTGHGYADYPGWPGYGVSVTTTDWVDGMIQRAGLTQRLHLPMAWAVHQDVFAAEKAE